MAPVRVLAFFMTLAMAASQSYPPEDFDYQLLEHTNPIKPGNEEDIRYRLPTSVIPLKYDIKLVPFIVENNFTFDGSVSIIVEAVESVQQITFHALELDIDSKSITVTELSEPFEEVAVANVEEDGEHEFYTLNLASSLKEKSLYVISIPKFTGTLNDQLQGFYRSSYYDGSTRRWLAVTQFEATHARLAFPCFDEPGLKARFTISISRPEGLRAISNMPQDGLPQLDTEHTDVVRYWDHFQETPLMSTYLVAFLVSDFEYLDDKMRVFAEPRMVNYTRYALTNSRGILDWLANYTCIAYDMPKMDQVAVPDFRSGAMENWGLVTYRSEILLINETAAPTNTKRKTKQIIAHEFAHQWFGDLASPTWWKYLWLNEGFAAYFQYFANAEGEPEWRLEEKFVLEAKRSAMQFDAFKTSHPMSVNVSTPSEIRSIFDPISYAKAGSVIRMMVSIVTEPSFRKGLYHYLKSRSYSSATPDDLFEALSNQMLEDNVTYDKVDFKEVMRTWTLQPGYPVVTVTRDYKDDEAATLSQERFFKDPDVVDDAKHMWYVPLAHTNQAESDFESTRPKHWLDPKDQTQRITKLGANDQWVLFNIKATGFYRVNYDDHNWNLLTTHLKSSSYQMIPPLNRVQLVDDAFNLAAAQKLQYSVTLNLSLYLRQETDLIPWHSAEKNLGELDEKFYPTPGRDVFIKFRKHLQTKPGSSDEIVDATEDDDRFAAERPCHVWEKACIDRALESVSRWMNEPQNNPIDPDLREAYYCTAVRYGNSSVVDFLREQQRKSILPWERTVIVRALGCSEDPDLLRFYLDETVASSSDLTINDKKTVFKSVYAHPFGLNVVFDYILENFGEVKKFIGPTNEVLEMICDMATRSSNPEHAHQLEQLLLRYSKDTKPYTSVIEKAIDAIRKNTEWYETTGKVIVQWINNYFATNPLLESA